jgi:hypothetical protein
MRPLGLRPEKADAAELDDKAGEEGTDNEGDQIPCRMHGRAVSHGASARPLARGRRNAGAGVVDPRRPLHRRQPLPRHGRCGRGNR